MNYKFNHFELLEFGQTANKGQPKNANSSSLDSERELSSAFSDLTSATFDTVNNRLIFEKNENAVGFAPQNFDSAEIAVTVSPVSSTIESLANDSHVTNVIPKIAINDAIGPAGSQDFALQYQAVVAISDYCSGALIAPNVVLSARHCEVAVGDPVFVGPDSLAPEFTANVTAVDLPAGFGFDLLDGGDVAILQLDAPVPTEIATPYRLTDATSSLVGEVFTLVGYGIHGVGSTGGTNSDGLRWAGQNIIDSYGAPESAFFGENQFSADFDDGTDFSNMIFGSSPDPIEFEAAPAQGDSGSPILVKRDGEYLIAGVLSGGTTPTGFYGDVSWWTGTSIYQDEIEAVGGEFVGALPLLDDHSDNLTSAATPVTFSMFGENFIARQSGAIGYENVIEERDVFRFALSEAGKVIIDARSLSSSLDSELMLFDGSGNLIAENDNAASPGVTSVNELDSQLIVNDLPAGGYFVAVSSKGESTGGYRFAIRQRVPVVDVDAFGDSFGTAFELDLSAAPDTTFVNSEIETGADNDFLTFTANTSGNLVVRSNALQGDLNTVLRGYDSERVLLQSNNNFNDSLDSRLVMPVEEGESYFLRLSSVGETLGTYRLSLRIKDAVAAPGAGKSLVRTTNIQLTLDESGVNKLAPMDMKNMAGWPEHGASQNVLLSGNI